MADWVWIGEPVVLAIHDAQLREHGGGTGLRSPDLLESALARPQNLAAYGEPTLAELAASYAFGVARNHPFVDGNKRTAFVLALTFIRLNGGRITLDKAEAVLMILRLAAGDLTEPELAAWLAANLASSAG